MVTQGYKAVSIPEELHKKVEQAIKEHKSWGYRTVTEFVKEAVRSYLRKLEYEDQEKLLISKSFRR